MATVDKNFRIKNGLIVEGTTGTINGNNILTESAGDSYILNLVGGATLVKSVDTATFTVDGSGNLTVNANVFDAYGAAATAQSNAESYTDSAVSTEATNRQTAINSALSVAEGYADTVSGNALTSAKSYTDSSISLEVTRANGAYDAAGAASTAQSNAEAYADTAATNAENAAKSYADTVAGTAQSNAEAYTDTAVANLVNGAPSTLDTLKKIDEAINNDANFSATLLSDITNAITTSESYTDSKIATEVTNRNSAISAQAATTLSDAESYTDTQIAAGNSTATPTYEALSVNSVSKIASAKVNVPIAGTATAYSWSASEYATAKALVKFSTATHTQVTEVLLTLDSANNIAITQFGEVGTNGELGTITANYASGVVYITVTTNQSSTDVMTYATLIQ